MCVVEYYEYSMCQFLLYFPKCRRIFYLFDRIIIILELTEVLGNHENYWGHLGNKEKHKVILGLLLDKVMP